MNGIVRAEVWRDRPGWWYMSAWTDEIDSPEYYRVTAHATHCGALSAALSAVALAPEKEK